MILRRQIYTEPSRTLTIRMPKSLYDKYVDFAYKHRLSLSASSSFLLNAALNAECGEPYQPYVETDPQLAESTEAK